MSRMKAFDEQAYIDRITKGPCFICEMLVGNPEFVHHIIYQDDDAVVFLNKYPTLRGYTLVAPQEHREQVTGDFSHADYLKLQNLIYRVAEALRRVVATERIYLLSLGSQEGNSHVHWHVAPLPPGVPFLKQQFEALRIEKGTLDLTDDEMGHLAQQIYQAMEEAGH